MEQLITWALTTIIWVFIFYKSVESCLVAFDGSQKIAFSQKTAPEESGDEEEAGFVSTTCKQEDHANCADTQCQCMDCVCGLAHYLIQESDDIDDTVELSSCKPAQSKSFGAHDQDGEVFYVD